ncbi:nucleoside diphosphate kinase [Gongronella butleri]|nr:nucleoside diphosphate kinase [Gongronella butleri]
MYTFFVKLLIVFLMYVPFLFIVFIPSRTILHSNDRHYEICKALATRHLGNLPYCHKETTLAVIKPDGIRYQANIKQLLRERGFAIVQKKWQQLTPEIIDQWYADKRNATFYPSLQAYLQSGPVEALLLERVDAIGGLRRIVGPTDPILARRIAPRSLRAIYGTSIEANAVHASDSPDAVQFEQSVLL